MDSSSSQNEGIFPSSKLEQIWEQYNQVMKENESQFLKTPSQEKVLDTSEILEKTLVKIKTSNKTLENKDIEFIPAFPTSELVLRVEKIPPLDIFYSPKHKVIVKRQRKKIKIEHSQAFFLGKTSFEVVWKGSVSTPSEELGRLT